MTNKFTNSEIMLARAEKTIPLGSQTFSKSKTAYPFGVSPFFLEKGKGCQVWDVDGNQYTDFVSGLLSVSLGYCDQTIDEAVIEQLKKGVSFSLPHRLEMEVAELLVEMVPCAEMVRFGKNGSDATSAAIRLARAFTGNEHIAVCGYHGWQDWYIGSTTRDLGVPECTKKLTHTFEFNHIESLKETLALNKFAAIIMEPMNVAYPNDNFLNEVKTLCHEHGALLIFDEMITGFRFAKGGAQALFNITPDLATFGKGMANGYPISAVVGRKDVMMLMEDIFFSGTFAGETLSLAASKAVLTKINNTNVLGHIHEIGEKLISGLQQILRDLGNPSWLKVCGHPSWSFLQVLDCAPYSSWQLKSLLLQEMAQRGILLGGGHNLNYSHKNEDIELLLTAYREVLSLLSKTINNKNFDEIFRGQVLQPLFKVR